MSNLLVQNIKHTNNTTSMSIDTSGQVTIRGEGSATTTNLQKGSIKGFCVIFKQSDNSVGDTFNLSSVADGGTGRINYTHINPYKADDGYIAIPNDGNYGHTMIAPQDLTTTACSQFSYTDSHSLSDTVMAAAFGGELA